MNESAWAGWITAGITGLVLILAEIIRKRTPSVANEQDEQDQEDQWRKELWEINRTQREDITMLEKSLKETQKLLAEVEKQNELLAQQNAQLTHEKEAWQVEREDMAKKITSLERDVFDQGRKIIQLERMQEQGGNGAGGKQA